MQLSNSQMKEMHRTRFGGGSTEFPCCHWKYYPIDTSLSSLTQNLPESHCSGDFMGKFHYIGMIDLVISYW